MYIFIDKDKFSETFGLYCIRQGSFSYDGFSTIAEAMQFIKTIKGA